MSLPRTSAATPAESAASQAVRDAFSEDRLPFPLKGPSFSWTARLLAGGFLSWLALIMWQPEVRAGYESLSLLAQLGMITCVLVLSATYWFLMVGKTEISAHGVRQDWLWPKRVGFDEVRSARFMGLPYFAWLIPPRLLLITHSGRRVMFNGGREDLHRAFARLTVVLQTHSLSTRPDEFDNGSDAPLPPRS